MTIHPWYDGNGRTARLLTTLVLHRGGYGLHGLYSLEEYYAERLNDYYLALQVGASHNYDEGRANAPVTGFLEYFCRGMVEALRRVQGQCRAAQERGTPDLASHLRRLDPRQRRVLSLFRDHAAVSTLQIALVLGLTVRTTGPLCRRWVAEGFLELADPARKIPALPAETDSGSLVGGPARSLTSGAGGTALLAISLLLDCREVGEPRHCSRLVAGTRLSSSFRIVSWPPPRIPAPSCWTRTVSCCTGWVTPRNSSGE